MELDEESLRQLMGSPHGETCGIAIMDGVRTGTPLTLIRGDGNVVTLAEVCDVRKMLEELGWRTNYKTHPIRRHKEA